MSRQAVSKRYITKEIGVAFSSSQYLVQIAWHTTKPNLRKQLPQRVRAIPSADVTSWPQLFQSMFSLEST